MSAEPSPGPWRAEEIGRALDSADPAFIRVYDADGKTVLDLLPHVPAGTGIERARANAALIIAASAAAKV